MRTLALAALLALAAVPTTVNAQEYPTRPIIFVVPSGPGGGTDILGRHVALRLGEMWKNGAVVENRAGAGSLTGTDYVAKARPDGHILLVGGIFNMVMNSALIKNLSYDPIRDFVPIGYTSAYPFLLSVRTDLPVNDLRGFVEYAKARPGKLTFASAGLGTLHHVWGTILVKSMGMDMLHVPFKSGLLAVQDVIAGRIDMVFDNISASKQYVQSNRLKGLAVSGTSRSAHLPNVPTVNEAGLAKFEGESWFGIFAPAATPAPVVAKLREAMNTIIREKEFVARVEQDGGRILDIPTRDQVQFLRDENERWSKMVRDYGVTTD
jgi:tripartite-type tricarboxylate transporter receptor subunit TctC